MLDTAPNGKVTQLLDALDSRTAAGDMERAVELFQPDCYWRDLVTFTWNIKTMEGASRSATCWSSAARRDQAVELEARGGRARLRSGRRDRGLDRVRNRGGARLRPHPAEGRPNLDTADDDEPNSRATRNRSGFAGRWAPNMAPNRDRKTWKEEREPKAAELGNSRQPYCVIVGGGQGGIALGARLRQLDVPTIIIEKNARPGDSWRKRYKSLCLHDPVWYDHLPYLPFPRQLAGLLAEGQDRRLAGDVHQGDGAELLGVDRLQVRQL